MAYAPLLARLGIWRLIGLLGDPAPDLPLPQREQYKADWSTTKHWDALQAQNNSIPLTDAAARNAGSLGNRPTIVLSASTAYVKQGAPADESRRVWNELHAELAALSTNSLHRVVEGTTHASLTFNREHAHETSAAILQVVESVRTGQPLHQGSDE